MIATFGPYTVSIGKSLARSEWLIGAAYWKQGYAANHTLDAASVVIDAELYGPIVGTVLLDTSRLARNQYIAYAFKHECGKRGVTILFAKTPELDGVSGIIIPAVLHAMDEVHSLCRGKNGWPEWLRTCGKGIVLVAGHLWGTAWS